MNATAAAAAWYYQHGKPSNGQSHCSGPAGGPITSQVPSLSHTLMTEEFTWSHSTLQW